MLIIYAITIFVSATLLFIVQPMFARMVLPLLGGSPAVWNTALVFYQAALLAGYGYAHATTTWLGARRQAALHLLLLLLPLLVLPIGIPAGRTPPTDRSPLLWLLLLLLLTVGLPFFVVSTSSPLLQRWFANTGHRAAADPYFLYAASNLGSMLALVSYPVLLEPYLRLIDQSLLWAAAYTLLVTLMLCCGIFLWRSPNHDQVSGKQDNMVTAIQNHSETLTPSPPHPLTLSAGRRTRWVLLSFVPSSLMISVTTYLSTDIAAIPLLWVIPLALYLLTFILVFASKPLLPHWLMVRALPMALLLLVIVFAAQANQPISLLIPLHLITFFIASMVCHGEIARDRPHTRHLTEFYLWMSVGGMLGGIFNALIAPLLFTSVLEYPLTIVLACLLGPRAPANDGQRWRILDLMLPAALGLGTIVLILLLQAYGVSGPLSIALMFGLPALICFSFSRRPLRFGLGVGAILLVSTLHIGEQGNVLYAERSFFGIHRVTRDAASKYTMLIHGNTLHGMQSLDPALSRRPLTYYYPSGPIGQVFTTYSGDKAKRSIAVVGLGTGALACYHTPGQQWTFYEIDPIVERIARDPRYFTFLQACAPDAGVVLGDARLSLAAARQSYDLIVLDAYSSDAIPVHLLTREALRLYLDRLAPGGLLAFHISNRHLDLEPVLGNLAQDAELVCLNQEDTAISMDEGAQGKTGSQWMVMARHSVDLAPLAADSRWKPVGSQPDTAVWTDNFSSLLSVFTWR